MSSVESIMAEFTKQKANYKSYRKSMTNLLKDLTKTMEHSIHSIRSRVKEEDNLREKIKKGGGKYRILNDVHDVLGLRIITYFSEDVREVGNIIEQSFNVDWENSGDKQKLFDPNQFGYLSLHYVVTLDDSRENLIEYRNYKGIRFEIQIRSILQHAWAEIEHELGYKLGKQLPYDIRRAFSRQASLLETADIEFNIIRHRLQEYQKELAFDITNRPGRVSLDAASLKVFLIENEGEKYCPQAMQDEAYLKQLSRMLNYLGIENIKSLKTNIEKYYDKVQSFQTYSSIDFKSWLEALCIYLIYRDQSFERVENFYKKFVHLDIDETAMRKHFVILSMIE